MDPPDIFETVIYSRWPCRTPSGLAVGSSICRDRASIVARAGFDQRVDNLQPEKTNCAACNRWKKKREKYKHAFSFSPDRRYEEVFGCSLKTICLKEKFWTSRFHWHRSKNRKHEQKQFSVSYWSAQPRQNITTGPPDTASNPSSTATQPHRTPAHSQQANHDTSPDFLGLSFPGGQAKAKFRMTLWRTRLEVRSQYNIKFDHGASSWTRHHLHGRPNFLPGSNCRRVCLLLWWVGMAER